MVRTNNGRVAALWLLGLALVAVFSSLAHGQETAGEVTNEEYAIYSPLIKEFYLKSDVRLAAIEDRTYNFNFARDEDVAQWTKKQKGLVESSTVDDFQQKNGQHWELKGDSFKLPVKTEMPSDADLRVIFHGRMGELEWMDYYKRYPDSNGLIRLSRVGFNTAHTQALVYVGNRCGPECGDGRFLLLEKTGGSWTIKKQLKKINF